jgi:hypothetical protein
MRNSTNSFLHANLGTGVPVPGTAVLLFEDSILIGIGLRS